MSKKSVIQIEEIEFIRSSNGLSQDEGEQLIREYMEDFFYYGGGKRMDEFVENQLRAELLSKFEKDSFLGKKVRPNQVESIFDRYVSIQVNEQELNYGRINLNLRKETAHTVKIANLVFNFRDSISDIISIVLETASLTLEKNVLNILTVLHIIYQCYDLLKIKLDSEHAKVIFALHKMNAYQSEVGQDILRDFLKESVEMEISLAKLSSILNELAEMKCISLNEGKIFLTEKVVIDINK